MGVIEATDLKSSIDVVLNKYTERNFSRIFNFSIIVESIFLLRVLLGPFRSVLLWCILVLRKFCEAVSECSKIYPISNQNACHSKFWGLWWPPQIMLHIYNKLIILLLTKQGKFTLIILYNPTIQLRTQLKMWSNNWQENLRKVK